MSAHKSLSSSLLRTPVSQRTVKLEAAGTTCRLGTEWCIWKHSQAAHCSSNAGTGLVPHHAETASGVLIPSVRALTVQSRNRSLA